VFHPAILLVKLAYDLQIWASVLGGYFPEWRRVIEQRN
jgi:hypothetical protein